MTETQRKIFDACASGNKAEIVRLTSEGCDLVQLHNEYGQTPLHIACCHRQFDIVRLLVEVYGAHPDIKDNKGCKPLHEACLAGDLQTIAYMLGVFFKHELFYISEMGLDVQGNNILHKACQSGNVAAVRYIAAHIYNSLSCSMCTMCKLNLYQDNVLSYHKCQRFNGKDLPCHQLHPLQLGLYDPNSQYLVRSYLLCHNSYGETPLHTACRHGHLNVVKYIVDEVRPVLCAQLPDPLSSFLSVTCQTGRADIIQYLLQAEERVPSKECFECELDHEEVSSAISVSDYSQRIHKRSVALCDSLLHTACKCGNVNLVKTPLRDYRYSSVTKDVNGDTPLQCACISDVVDIINLLVSKFLNLHTIQNSKGNTPLHIACEWGSFNAAHILITRLHCDPNVCNEDGETPLHLACKYGRLEFCRLLLEDGRCNVKHPKQKKHLYTLHVVIQIMS